MTKCPALAIAAFLSGSIFAQPIEAKLDHVVIAVHGLETAKRIYSELGFAVTPGGRHPGGTQNALAGFKGNGYLELLTPYDATLPGGSEVAKLLEHGEGALTAGLEIDSAEQAARDLSAAGIKIKGPTPGTIMRPGDKEPPPTRWWSISFVEEVASRPLFLIQYIRDPATPRPPRPPHPNTASALSALLVAVNDPEKAVAGYGNIGKLSPTEINLPEFGAVAKEIVLARGSIFLMRATDPAGPTARHLKTQGEGILGVRLAVTDLDETRRAVRRKNVSKDEQSVLVSPENAAGVWLQFGLWGSQ
jgi:catechol 2,3-dioxygenase-like lactoylglutathione lyase family enzyme